MRKVDTLLRGGIVVTMDDQRTVYENGYVAIDGGRVVGVGPDRECDVESADTRRLSDVVVLPRTGQCPHPPLQWHHPRPL